MKTYDSDIIEGYLEPLYLPAIPGVLLSLSMFAENSIAMNIFLILLLLTSVVVIIFEFLVIVKLVKPIIAVKKLHPVYRYVRWILALVGFGCLLFTLYVLVFGTSFILVKIYRMERVEINFELYL